MKNVLAAESQDGVGVRLRRAIGMGDVRNLSPFLMLDFFKVHEGSGFADHPHRGQSTLTYMMEGYFQHEDFAGHSGVIGPGDIQLMCAGKGIMHAEMPLHRDKDGNKLPDPRGVQLWLDLPRHAKLSEPSYQELASHEMPYQTPRASEPKETEGEGWRIKVVVGESHGAKSPVTLPQGGGCWFFDVELEPHGWVFQEVPKGWNAVMYVVDGPVSVGTDDKAEYNANHLLVMSNAATAEENGVRISNPSGKNARAVLIAGEPMDHPVVQYGPFVMNSRDEIIQAVWDFQHARNGFERAGAWESKIAKNFH